MKSVLATFFLKIRFFLLSRKLITTSTSLDFTSSLFKRNERYTSKVEKEKETILGWF